MQIIEIKSFSEFESKVDKISQSTLCRGVPNSEFELIPFLFRNKHQNEFDLIEKNMMWIFKSHAKAYLANYPDSELEWLTIAQHHGLPTRLLDWTLSPIVALYFAVSKHKDYDGVVYVYDIKKFKKESEIDLKSLSEIVAIFPPHATNRVAAQSGAFTIHPTNIQKLDKDEIQKIIIPKKEKRNILWKLYKYGIHPASLFPGLDGITGYIKFQNYYI